MERSPQIYSYFDTNGVYSDSFHESARNENQGIQVSSRASTMSLHEWWIYVNDCTVNAKLIMPLLALIFFG